MTTKKSKVKKELLSIAASVPSYDLDLNLKVWTAGPHRFAQIPQWATQGLVKPLTTRGLEKTVDSTVLQKQEPFKHLVIYPSVDPYLPEQRELYRILMKECWVIRRANKIIQQLVIQKSKRSILPRTDQEINEELLEKWKEEKILVPLWGKEKTPNDILKYIDKLSTKLDLDQLVFDVFLFERTEGRAAIGLFPETRNKDKKYVIPTALRLIRPEILRRPRINFKTGEFQGVEVTGLSSNGSVLDGNRAIYFNNSKNLDLFGDFYGTSEIEAIADLGRVLLIIYTKDMLNAANKTWHTRTVFQHELPTNAYSKAKEILEEFNENMANMDNADVSVTHNVTPVNVNTNAGDITGLISIENSCIEGIAGHNNVPPYMLSKGKAGNLGGNANQEEAIAFELNEIRPIQERYEKTVENQFYDRILAILFDTEPDNLDSIPVKITHNFEKPNMGLTIDPDQWNIMMFLVDNGLTTMEQVMERFGLRDMMSDSPTQGTDTSPTIKTWEGTIHPTWKKSSSWDRPELKRTWNIHNADWNDKIHEEKINLIKTAQENLKIKNKIDQKKLKRS